MKRESSAMSLTTMVPREVAKRRFGHGGWRTQRLGGRPPAVLAPVQWTAQDWGVINRVCNHLRAQQRRG